MYLKNCPYDDPVFLIHFGFICNYKKGQILSTEKEKKKKNGSRPQNTGFCFLFFSLLHGKPSRIEELI